MASVTQSPRILITGSHGQLGRELERSFSGVGEIFAVGRDSLDLADADAIRAFVRKIEPAIILNAAAYTAVDRAESEPELANAINAKAPGVLAEEAKRRNAILVHYSTDYVFDGTKPDPWVEDEHTSPLSVYGQSKLDGELAVAGSGANHLIFRTSWVYGPHGKNFLFTMLRLAKERDQLSIVDDQIGAPTTSIELANATRSIVEGVLDGRFGSPDSWIGTYHMTCGGSTSWFGFAQAIFARAAHRLGARIPQLNPIPTESYPTPARRPRNSVLSNAKLNARFGVPLAPWESALDAVIKQLPQDA